MFGRAGLIGLVLLGVAALATESPAQEAKGTSPEPKEGTAAAHQGRQQIVLAALVNGEPIAWEEYVAALNKAARDRFYHGSIPDDKLAELKVEVIEDVIMRRLLLKEAGRLGIEADAKAVDERLAIYEQRNKDNPEWKEDRAKILPLMRQQMLNNTRLARLEAEATKVTPPGEAELNGFYEKNPDTFTEPTRERLGLILLGVEPSSTKETWFAARAEAEKIHKKLTEGADFAEIARLRSTDGSATQGGDMGYLHRGMLSQPAQEAVDKLKNPGDISLPVELLQGYAIFRLLDRQAPQKRPFEEIKARVSDLYVRDRKEKQWAELKARLRKAADVSINPAIYGKPGNENVPKPRE
jgi:hypothetical protein